LRKKNVAVFLPHEWENIFRSAWRKRPYEVIPLHYSDFLDLKQMCHSLLRESAASKIRWMSVKCLRFDKENPGVIQVRYSHEGDYESVNLFGNSGAPAYSATPAYKSQLPNSVAKYNDLQKLCTKGIIPRELHG